MLLGKLWRNHLVCIDVNLCRRCILGYFGDRMKQTKQFRIVKCSDPSLWYNTEVGEVYPCERGERLTGGDILWTREDSEYGQLLNWVWAHDVQWLTD
jgi:hypothetical protein